MASIITTPSRKQSRAAFAYFADQPPDSKQSATGVNSSAAVSGGSGLTREPSVTALLAAKQSAAAMGQQTQPQSVTTLRTARANSVASRKASLSQNKSRLFASPSMANAHSPSLDDLKQTLAAIDPVKPSKTSGGHYWGHLPPIHQPWNEDDFRFPTNAERMYSHKVLLPNWYEDRAREQPDFIKPLPKYIPDRCYVSDYHENISFPARYYPCYDRQKLTGAISDARMRQLRGGVPPILVRDHQDALHPVERADRLNTITHVDIDLNCPRDKLFNNVPRQPAQQWGLENKKRLKWVGEMRNVLGFDNTTTYRYTYGRQAERSAADARQYLKWMGHSLVNDDDSQPSTSTSYKTSEQQNCDKFSTATATTCRDQQRTENQTDFSNNPLFGTHHVEYVPPVSDTSTRCYNSNDNYST